MPILSLRQCSFVLVLLSFSLASQADDLHFKKTISVGGTTVSSSEVWVKGARERSVTNSPTGTTVMLRQCDLKRSVTLNEKAQAYIATGDIQDEEAMKAAALLGGGQAAPSVGGTITQTTTIADTGERKPMLGFTARHLKMTVQVDSSANTCTQVSQKYEIDGWYADVTKDSASCQAFLPPIHQNDGCNDRVIARHSGTGKPGYPLVETITLHNADSTTTKIDVATIAMPKQVLTADKFDVPTGYHQVNSIAELNNAAPVQSAASYSAMPAQQMAQGNGAAPQASQFGNMGGAGGMMAQAQQMGAGQMGMGQSGMPTGAPIALPQTLGPKAPGRIRIGIAPAQAQLGQGNDAQNDYGTPVRNSIIFLMSGPSIEIAALDSRIPMQVQSEAQQKQCDYILMSGVTITHGATSGFGKFMKAGNMAASMTPVGMMAHTAGAMATAQAAAAAAQAASQAAAMQTVQQKAMSQLAGLNGQVKSKDDVTVEYHLYPTGQDKAVLDNVLKGKAKHDGEDVLTPLMQQAANSVLTQVTKK